MNNSRPILARLTPGLRHIAFLCAVSLPAAAIARDDPWQPKEDNAAWRSECSACHFAFPPAMLSPDDWSVLMAELDKHFGANASLDAKVQQEISTWLRQYGHPDRQFGNPDEMPRVTGTAWFVRKHKSAIRLLLKGRVKSLVDCAACHKEADKRD